MTEPTAQPTPPTYFGNAVTVIVGTDEASIEIRRLMPTHKEFDEATKRGTQASPPVTPEQFYNSPPIAKIVLTFTAAKYLRDILTSLLPRFEASRKEGL